MVVDADGERNGGDGPPTEERAWTIHPAPKGGFPIFGPLCGLLPLVTAWLVLSPCLPASVLAWGLGFLAVLHFGGIAIDRFSRGPGRIRLGTEGVRVGKRSVPWESITQIGRGPWRSGWMLVVYGRRRLGLAPCPVVLREVIPEIVRRRPGIRVSQRARRAIENPDSVLAVPSWAKAVTLAAGLALALLPLFTRYATSWWLLAGPICVGALVMAAPGFAVGRERHNLGDLYPYAGVLALAYPIVLFADVPLRAMDALVAMVTVLFLSVAVAAAFDWRLKTRPKAAILCLAVAAPLAVYHAEGAFDLKRTEITNLLGPGFHSGSLAWSADGRWAMETWATESRGERQSLVDTIALRSYELPVHKGSALTWGLGSAGAVRAVRSGDTRDLFLYRVEDRQEVELSAGMKTGIMPGRCISPSGGLICWISMPESNEPQRGSVMVHDVRALATRRVEVIWPDGNDIDWQTCWWSDDHTLAVQGSSPGLGCRDLTAPSALHILRVDYPSGATQHVAPAERFVHWRVSPDGRHAFALCSEGDVGQQDAWYLDLLTGLKTPLEGNTIPQWQSDGRAAYRVADFHEQGVWLCRFQVEGAKEERVLRIPQGVTLASLSPRGRFAILRDAAIRIRPLRLVELATGDEIRLDVPMFASAILFDGFGGGSNGFPWLAGLSSRWSPDETRFAVPSVAWGDGNARDLTVRLFLHAVPPAWRKGLVQGGAP